MTSIRRRVREALLVVATLAGGLGSSSAEEWPARLRQLGHPEFSVRAEAMRWFESSPPIPRCSLPELFRLASTESLEVQRQAAEILARHPFGLLVIIPRLIEGDPESRCLAEWTAIRVFEEAFPRWDPQSALAWRPRFRDARLPWRLPGSMTFRDLADAVQASDGLLVPVLDPAVPQDVWEREIEYEQEADAFPSPIDALLRDALSKAQLDDVACDPFLAMTSDHGRSPDEGAGLFVDLLRALGSGSEGRRRSAAWDLGALGLPGLTRTFGAMLLAEDEAQQDLGAWGLAGSGSRPVRLDDPAVVARLVEELETEDPRLRRGLEAALYAAEPTVLRPLVRDTFESTSPQRVSPGARASRLRLLGAVATRADLAVLQAQIERALEGGQTDASIAIEARMALGLRMDLRDVELLVPALSGDEAVGRAAALALRSGMAEGGLTRVEPLLEHPDASVRRRAARALSGVAIMELTPMMEIASAALARETDPQVCLALGRTLGERFDESEPAAQKRLVRALGVLEGLADREAAIRLRALGAKLPQHVFQSELQPELRSWLDRKKSTEAFRWVAAILLQERVDTETLQEWGVLEEIFSVLRRAFESARPPFAAWAAEALAEAYRADHASREFSFALELGYDREDEALLELGRVAWRALARRLAREGQDEDLRSLRLRLIRWVKTSEPGFADLLDSIRAEVDRVAWEARLYRPELLLEDSLAGKL